MLRLLRRIVNLVRVMSRTERVVLYVLTGGCLLGLAGLLRLFYVENTVVLPTTGGTYIEGSVGSLQPVNPWFTTGNDVNRDVAALVFSGLLQYNPLTRAVEEDLAELEISGDGKTYTAKLRPDLFWHDSTEEHPHTVTADDVVFTFTTIQDPKFPNTILAQNFRGVTVEKIDDRTVRFRLEQPYSFFTSNLTLGLLPKRSFDGVPTAKLMETLDFGFHPIGAGPYQVKTIMQNDLTTDVTLERFERPYPPSYNLDQIVLRIFPDYSSLLADIRNLDGVRIVPRGKSGEPLLPGNFVTESYSLPQYVALFFNLDRPFLQDQNLRVGLQLGTDKQSIADALHETAIIDTPLLEIDTSDWRYQFDAATAQGALFASKWNVPEKIRLQRLLEQREANERGILQIPPVLLLDTGAILTITGSHTGVPSGVQLNAVALQNHPTASGAWIVHLPTVGTGALRLGPTLIRLTDAKGGTLDSAYVWRTTEGAEYRRAVDELRLVDLFIQSRSGTVPATQRVTVQDFFVDQGMLRRRRPLDPVSVRQNDAGQRLSLKLLTSPAPAEYPKIAEMIREQWAALGVEVSVTVASSREQFQDKMLRRDYDILLFGQSLLDNLDSYPFWHSSNVQKVTGSDRSLRLDAYNLSQYSSFKADALLETIRRTRDEKERKDTLALLRDELKQATPAVFLYSPTYITAHSEDILGVRLGHLSLHDDRFSALHLWYRRQKRVFKEGIGWLSFITWLPNIFRSSPAR